MLPTKEEKGRRKERREGKRDRVVFFVIYISSPRVTMGFFAVGFVLDANSLRLVKSVVLRELDRFCPEPCATVFMYLEAESGDPLS